MRTQFSCSKREYCSVMDRYVMMCLYSYFLSPLDHHLLSHWKSRQLILKLVVEVIPKFHFADKIVRAKCLSMLDMSVDSFPICFWQMILNGEFCAAYVPIARLSSHENGNIQKYSDNMQKLKEVLLQKTEKTRKREHIWLFWSS